MRKYISTVIFAFSASFCLAQVGIDNPTPDPSSVLDLSGANNTDKGLLIPQVEDTNSVTSPADGLLIYQPSSKKYLSYNANAGHWMALNPFEGALADTKITVINKSVGIGTSTPEEKLHVGGNVKVDDTLKASALEVPGFSGNALVPTGGIIMWSGTTAPAGWALCNGNNGTPNLSGRFVVGYDGSNSDYNWPGNKSQGGVSNGRTGGLEEVTLTEAQMPSHTHDGTTEEAGNHKHNIYIHGPSGTGSGDRNRISGTKVTDNDERSNKKDEMDNAGEHTHSFTTDPTGGGNPHENRPPYYVLAYIMKL